MPESGTLYVVATPIGNIADMSPRAQQTLAEVSLIVAEDTRHSKRLLQQFGIQTPMLSLHEHNEERRAPEILDRLQQGQDIALISDAGTPLLSDPGFVLVRAARKAGITISPVPGSSAVTAALSVSGLPTDKFVFAGFLPAKSAARRARLQELMTYACTVVVFESTHRIMEALQDISAELGAEQELVLARELSKRYETVLSGRAIDLLQQLEQDPDQQRGEFVLLFNFEEPAQGDQSALQHCLAVLLTELPLKQAVTLAAKITGESRNDAYAMALEMKE